MKMTIRNLTEYLDNLGKDEVNDALQGMVSAIKKMDQVAIKSQELSMQLREALHDYESAKSEFKTALLDLLAKKPRAGSNPQAEKTIQSVSTAPINANNLATSTYPSINQSIHDRCRLYPYKEGSADEDRLAFKLTALGDPKFDQVKRAMLSRIPKEDRFYNRHEKIWVVRGVWRQELKALAVKFNLGISKSI